MKPESKKYSTTLGKHTVTFETGKLAGQAGGAVTFGTPESIVFAAATMGDLREGIEIFLAFISSAFVPTDSMPGPVRWFAENQPVTSIVNSTRHLLMGQSVGIDLWIALAWCGGILVVAFILAMVVYRRRIS